MATIVEENKNFRKELADLKRGVDFNDNELRQLKKDHQTTSQMNTMLKKELKETKEELDSTKKVLQDQEDETQNLWFSKIPWSFTAYRNVFTLTHRMLLSASPKRLMSILNKIVHKLQRKKGNKPIIAKFCSHKAKAKIYRERFKLRNVKVSNTCIFPHYSPADESQNRIYITENLTTFRRDLLSKALQKERIKSCHLSGL